MTLRRRLRASLAAVLLATLAVLLPLPATTAEAASCGGVWEVVETTVRCTTSYANGLDALRGAGFSIQTLGSGYVCQINGAPSTCTMATPYWSYWHANRNADGTWGDWQYSTRGASVYVPTAGSAEGWSFGNGTPPAGTPPVSATTTTTKATSTTTTTTTTKAATTTSTTSKVTSTSKAATSTSAAATTSTSAAATNAPAATPAGTSSAAPVTPGATSATASPTASASESAAATPGVATSTPAAGGSPVGVLATAGVVVLGGAGLGAFAWRARRR